MPPALGRLVSLQLPPSQFVVPSTWADALSLTLNVPATYTLPLDASGHPAGMLRLSGISLKANSSGQVFFNCFGAAVVPSSNVTDGSGSIEAVGPQYYLSVPQGCTAISFVATVTGALIIEAWSR